MLLDNLPNMSKSYTLSGAGFNHDAAFSNISTSRVLVGILTVFGTMILALQLYLQISWELLHECCTAME